MDQLTLTPGALGADLGAARRARREVTRFLERHGLDERREDVLLVISELITNSVLHAQAAPELVLRVVARASPCWSSRSAIPRRSSRSSASRTSPIHGGRGMRLVSAIADKWGVEVRGDAGKTIWAEFRRTD